jgi:adenylyltransferase/sulfurtransferase
VSARYARQVALPGFGPAAQQRVEGGSVTVVGVGGLGCPAAMYLAAAGVGRVTLVDSDHVAESNLPRQILYGAGDVGSPKAEAAARVLRALGATGEVAARRERLAAGNAAGLFAGADVVLDAVDNLATSLLVADAAADVGASVVWGAAEGYDGQVGVFPPGRSLRELVPDVPWLDLESCEGGAVLGPVCGVVGAAMAVEAIKLLAGLAPADGLSVYEGRIGRWSHVPLGAPRG